MTKRLAFLALAAVLAGGCSHGGDRSALDRGVHLGLRAKVHRVGEAEARRVARTAEAAWRRDLRRRAEEAPARRFPNLPPAALRQRLSAAAHRYGFHVVSLDLMRPRQLAPAVVVETSDYTRLARATPAILHSIDPRSRATDDRKGWRYEGFFFEARDERGVPFLVAFNAWRGPHAGGGQWARSDALFPFAHG